MKKILTMALCLGVAGSMFSQKAAVDAASKMSGKADKLEEARNLIKQATSNPETAKDARTFYVGGKLEFDLYDAARTKQMLNPKDESIDPMAMATQLLNGYKWYAQALPLDTVVDEKGKTKTKYSKDIVKAMNGHFNDIFNAGGTFYNAKKYYPEAYEAFMIYGNLPKSAHADKALQAIPDSVINTSFFNAGLSAYAGNALPQAAAAFKAARLNNTDNSQNYIYEIACWQFMTQKDSTLQDKAKKEIEEIAMAGYKKFGTKQMIFLNNLVNSMVMENRLADALALVNEQIATDASNPALYGLLGYIYDHMEKDAESVESYKKAASFQNADFETLKNAARKLLKTGTEKLNALDARTPANLNELKTTYFIPAKEILDRAKSMKESDSDVDYLLENVNYALETYFK